MRQNPLPFQMQTDMPQDRPDPLATRASLLGRLKDWEDRESWEEFARTYSRLIRGVAIRAGLTEAEAKDVEQDTLVRVAKTIHEFQSNPERGTFKGWLLNLTRWRIADEFRRRPPAGAPPSDSTATGDRTSTINRIPEPDTLEKVWETEWQKNLIEAAVDRIGRRVKPKHFQIFELYAIRHWPAAKVARELGVNLVQVYLVNHRLTRLMKEEIAFLEKDLL